MTVTADTITDEQIRELRTMARNASNDEDAAVYLNGNAIFCGEVIDWCQVALGLHMPSSYLTREQARARCAEILNARGGK